MIADDVLAALARDREVVDVEDREVARPLSSSWIASVLAVGTITCSATPASRS